MILNVISKVPLVPLLDSSEAWKISQDNEFDTDKIEEEKDINELAKLWLNYIAITVNKYITWGLTEVLFPLFVLGPGPTYTQERKEEFRKIVLDALKDKKYYTYIIPGSTLVVGWDKNITN